MNRPPLPPFPLEIVASIDTVLTPLEPEDASELFVLTDANRDRLRRWLPWLDNCRDTGDTLRHILHTRSLAETGTGWALAIRRDGEIAGVVSYNTIHNASGVGTIGYWIGERWEGTGVMRTACQALVACGFRQLQLNRQVIAAATGNTRSRTLAERLGFSFEGVAREAEWLYDRYVDHANYALLRADWLRGRG